MQELASASPGKWILGFLLGLLLGLPAVQAAETGAYQQAIWFQDGQPTIQARSVLAQLQAAADYGLRVDDYRTGPLVTLLERLREGMPLPAATVREADPALSNVVLRFAHDLHFGRVDAKSAGFAINPARAPLDGPALLATLASARDPAAEFAALEPPFLHYRLLKAMLHRYQELARQPELTRLPAMSVRALKPGDHYSGAPALRRLLQALGDLPAAGASENEVIDPALVAGLQQFQTRHGLTADGVLAAKTYRQLTTPLAARVQQIELTLERWRWLPEFKTPPIIVNIPQFQLFAFRTTADHAADILQMPVIVGQAYRYKRTPAFVSELRYVVFRPYWDVPESIVRREMLAPMRADPGYLARNNLELVRGGGDDGVVEAPSAANIEALAAGRLRLRQRPGADNALGLIKFVMPNDYGVYLHSTPARHLFDKARRDFSHGCIRLSEPVALAVQVLRANRGDVNQGDANQGDWSAAAVEAAMHGEITQRVALAVPVQVMVVYGTALATEAGRILFFDDIYGHDHRLEALLVARPDLAISGR